MPPMIDLDAWRVLESKASAVELCVRTDAVLMRAVRDGRRGDLCIRTNARTEFCSLGQEEGLAARRGECETIRKYTQPAPEITV